MKPRIIASCSIAGLLAACGGVSRSVDLPPTDVRMALAQNANTLAFADQLPGASHSTERNEQGVIWHFTVKNRDYARYVVTIADTHGGSRVSGKFEEVDGPDNPAVPYLRDTAKAVSEETLLATLENRSIDVATLQRTFITSVITDPTKIVGMQQAIMSEAVNATKGLGDGSTYHSQPYDRTPAYDRTPNYDRDRVTTYEYQKRVANEGR